MVCRAHCSVKLVLYIEGQSSEYFQELFFTKLLFLQKKNNGLLQQPSNFICAAAKLSVNPLVARLS